ncbi:MAG: hypothetical protein HC925_09385 [Coleofasciculaceae cyanobacterium SM2_3_26]|nr:hypothetical protein [Coleofasciculaceae cyanobacterium SM2_3_26]
MNANRCQTIERFAVAIAAALIPALAALPTVAQVSNDQTDPLRDLQQDNEVDPLSAGGNNGFNVLDLIHQSQQQGNINYDEFIYYQQRNINDAAAEFRSQQQQLLEQPAAESLPIHPISEQ